MPLVRVSWLAGRDDETKQKVAAEITDVLAKSAGANPEKVDVIFEDIPRSNWANNGKTYSNPNKD